MGLKNRQEPGTKSELWVWCLLSLSFPISYSLFDYISEGDPRHCIHSGGTALPQIREP